MQECGARPRRTGYGDPRPAGIENPVPVETPPGGMAATRREAQRQPYPLGPGRSRRPDPRPRCVLYSYLNPAIDFVKTYTATTAAKAQFHEILRENKHLHNASRLRTTRPWSLAGHALGMVAEGETPIVIHGLGG